MRILALDAALTCCSVALVENGALLAECTAPGGRGQSAVLAPMVEAVLTGKGGFDAVAVTIGPGSFTGLRSAIALAHGLATGPTPLVAVTVAEALAEAVGDPGHRAIWTAIDSRRGRVFLDIAGILRAVALDDLPIPIGPIAVAGDAAIAVTAWLAARGHDVRLTDARVPHARHVANAALHRLAGRWTMRDVQPLYVDPPEARLPAGGLRPGPQI
jgi:tRNA threonylcarbamoyladenosine biosynthesis protein TsaB